MRPIFIEATPNDTELRLLKMLRKHIPRLVAEASLAEAWTQLREGRVTGGPQGLAGAGPVRAMAARDGQPGSSQLVRALRQCDGANVQGLILVRDDFWLSTTRFMQALEIPQLEGVELSPRGPVRPTHAKSAPSVRPRLRSAAEPRLVDDEQRFLDRAVQDLAHDGKVICVQTSRCWRT